MSTDHHEVSDVTEVVGLFETRESLENAISEVKSVGFEDSELSLLASHDSIEVADMSGRTWREQLVAFIDELRYEQPLIASGAIFLAGDRSPRPLPPSLALLLAASPSRKY